MSMPDWTLKKNAQWVDEGIKNKKNFTLPLQKLEGMIQTSGPYKGQPTVYNMEIQQLKDAGCVKVGDYCVHLDNVSNSTP